MTTTGWASLNGYIIPEGWRPVNNLWAIGNHDNKFPLIEITSNGKIITYGTYQ